MSNRQQQLRETFGDEKEVWLLTPVQGVPREQWKRERGKVLDAVRNGLQIQVPGKRPIIVGFDRCELISKGEQATLDPLPEPVVVRKNKPLRSPLFVVPPVLTEEVPVPAPKPAEPALEPKLGDTSQVDATINAWLELGTSLVGQIKQKTDSLRASRDALLRRQDELQLELEQLRQMIEGQRLENTREIAKLSEEILKLEKATQTIEGIKV